MLTSQCRSRKILLSTLDETNHMKYHNATATQKNVNAGMVQLVECLLAKEEVTGSSPVARSEPLITSGSILFLSRFHGRFAMCYTKGIPHGARANAISQP